MEPTKLYGSPESNFTVTPKASGNRIYFNLDRRGGTACWDKERGEFIKVRNEVGEAVKAWLIRHYELS